MHLFIQQLLIEGLLYERQKSKLSQNMKCFHNRLRFKHSPAEIGESLQALGPGRGIITFFFFLRINLTVDFMQTHSATSFINL